MRCDGARPLLLAGADEPELLDHLAGCAACAAALEASDPVVAVLMAAKPEPVAPPAALAATILARWRPRRRLEPGAVVVAAAVVAVAAGIELVVGAEPGRLVGTAGSALTTVEPAAAALLGSAEQVRTAVLETPILAGPLTALAAATGALWLRVALRPPTTWRSAR